MKNARTVHSSKATKATAAAKRVAPKATSVRNFVSDFYSKHGKVMSKLAYE